MILPNFLIIGVEKAGTTALANFLRQHPDVCFCKGKESFFFDRKYYKGIDWFSSHFDHYDGEKAIGEGTVRMLQSKKAPFRIAKDLEDVKLFCILRNPIDRAYSQFNYYLYTGSGETAKSFGKIIRNEDNNFGRDIIQQGFYINHLERYENIFGRDQINVILYKQFRENPIDVIQNIYRELNIDPHFIPVTDRKHNATKYPKSIKTYYILRKSWKIIQDKFEERFPLVTEKLRSSARKLLFEEDKPRMKEEDRIYLKKIYEPYNRELEEWLDVNLSHWK